MAHLPIAGALCGRRRGGRPRSIAGGSLPDGTASRAIYRFDPRQPRVRGSARCRRRRPTRRPPRSAQRVRDRRPRRPPARTARTGRRAARARRRRRSLRTARSDLAAVDVGDRSRRRRRYRPRRTAACSALRIGASRGTSRDAGAVTTSTPPTGPDARRAAARRSPLVYVPNSQSNTVDVIDQRTFRDRRALRRRRAAAARHAVVGPAHALRRQRPRQQPHADRPAHRPAARAPDPGGRSRTTSTSRPTGASRSSSPRLAAQLDFRDPRTMRLAHVAARCPCRGVDHMDFTADGRVAARELRVLRPAWSRSTSRTQRVARTSSACRRGSMPAGRQALARRAHVLRRRHGSRRRLADRRAHVPRSDRLPARPAPAPTASTRAATRGSCTSPTAAPGRSSVMGFAHPPRRHDVAHPATASPDMGGVSADGRTLWLSGRYNAEVYAIDTRTGRLRARSPSAPGRTASASGRSRAATRSATPGSCASAAATRETTLRRAASPRAPRRCAARSPPSRC